MSTLINLTDGIIPIYLKCFWNIWKITGLSNIKSKEINQQLDTIDIGIQDILLRLNEVPIVLAL